MPLIKYVSKDPQHPKRGYSDWLAGMLTTHNIRKKALKTWLNVSEFSMQEIQQHVNFVRVRRPWLSKAFLQSDIADMVLHDRSATYYDNAGLMRYLIDTPAYTRQTKIVPVEAALGGETALIKAYRRLEELEHIAWVHAERDKPETVDAYRRAQKARIDWLDKNCPEHIKAVVARTHRQSLKEIPVKPFDWFSELIFIPANTATAKYRNVETLYRSMIRQGAIKITFGSRKTFFYVPVVEPAEGRRFSQDYLLMPASFPADAADDATRGGSGSIDIKGKFYIGIEEN